MSDPEQLTGRDVGVHVLQHREYAALHEAGIVGPGPDRSLDAAEHPLLVGRAVEISPGSVLRIRAKAMAL